MSSYYHPHRYFDDVYALRQHHGQDEDCRSLVRSMSQPSLARSASEFTEHWAVRSRHWESPENSPSTARSTRTRGFRMTESRYERSSGWFGDADSEASFK
uniref:Uncharacterized protein n=2 Tax=Rhodnius prolixus TaxID=13249 RepID=A0A4P6DAR0_RHOPR